MARTVAEKMGVRAGSRAHLVGAPAEAVAAMRLPELDLAADLTGAFDYLHLFVTRQEDMRAGFGPLRDHLAPDGRLWVSWPKGGRLGTDLTIRSVIAIGYDHGLVESTALRVDDTWSALKFTRPKPGKTYRNSYGTLPGGPTRSRRPGSETDPQDPVRGRGPGRR
ncbi:DUF3052 domain-containing protein [Georgenia sp. 311]|uniref:DUF3052 domain-containing protein n=1 Tax=Georgenia sp. 311 TaxID=2585134 RepID=UPI001C3F275E|nr:DUF3052 domain-containing protein [Georgenia sp. 311]